MKNVPERARRFLVNAYYTLNGWRFSDLKETLIEEIRSSQNSSEATSLVPLDLSAAAAGMCNVAFVGISPPAKSGISIFNINIMTCMSERVDFFTQAKEYSIFLYNKVFLDKKTDGKVVVSPLEFLLAYGALSKYEKIIFAFGNSDDHIPVFKSLLNYVDLFGADNVIVQLHDLCLHNILQKSLGVSVHEYGKKMSKLYELDASDLDLTAPWRASRSLIEKECYGLRVFQEIGVNKFIVHSRYAETLVKNDVSNSVTVKVLFHPVFPASIPAVKKNKNISDESGRIIIGSFGYPGPEKGTDLVISAVANLRNQGVHAQLRIIGYNAEAYIEERYGNKFSEWLIGYEPRTQEDFEKEIVKCDLAIQLRVKNLGESSGVVPSMICHGIPTIVNSMGSFAEYGDAVHYTKDLNVSSIVSAINHVLDVGVSQLLIDEYKEKFSQEKFCRLMFESEE